MAKFDPSLRGYDPSLRSYRVFVYCAFFVGLLWFTGSMLWSIVDYLF